MKEEIIIQRKWLVNLVQYAKRTKDFMDSDLSSEERMVLLKAGIPEIIGYISSADTLLICLKINK